MASVDRQHDRDNFAVLRGGLVELKGLLNYDITSHKVLIDLSIRFLTVSPILFQQSASSQPQGLRTSFPSLHHVSLHFHSVISNLLLFLSC